MNPDFTPKQVAFMRSWLICRDGTKAAIEAGYAKGSAHVTGSRLLSNAKIKAALEEVDRRIAKRQQVSAEEVIEVYKAIATANMFDFITYDADGHPQFDLEMVERNRRELGGAIKTLQIKRTSRKAPGREEVITEVDVKVGLIDKMQALDTLNKATGALTEKNPGSKEPNVIINVTTGIPGPPGHKLKQAEPVVSGELGYDSE